MFSKTLRRIYIPLHTLKLEIVIFLPTTSIYLFLGTMGWEWVTPVESVDSLSSSKSSFSYFQKILQCVSIRTQCSKNNVYFRCNLKRIYIFTLSVEDPLALPRLELELPPDIEINRSKSHPLWGCIKIKLFWDDWMDVRNYKKRCFVCVLF